MDVATLASLVIGLQSQSTKLDAQAALTRKAEESNASVLTLLDSAGVGTAAQRSNPSGTGSLINQVA